LGASGNSRNNNGRGPGRPIGIAVERNEFEARSISFPVKLWRILESLQVARGEGALSSTVRALLMERLAEMAFLKEEEKKALGR